MGETKTCFTCKEIKSVTEFHKSNQRAGARTKTAGYIQSRCKSCQAKDRDFYKKRNQQFINQEKLKHGCVDCGYKIYACVLDFHHVDPKQKSFSLASTKASGSTIQALIIEIAKCIVLCSNCHRIRHHVKKEI